MRIERQFLRFAVVGAAGYFVDVGVLYLMLHFGLDLYSARVVSFVTAASSTWLGNRYYTFGVKVKPKGRLRGEWAAYLGAMTLGGLVNYGVYVLLISSFLLFWEQPWLAVAGGMAASMSINFTLARKILYRIPE